METVLETLKKYVQYISNTSLVPLSSEIFDDDWEPIGPDMRRWLITAGWVTEDDDGLRITDKGRRNALP